MVIKIIMHLLISQHKITNSLKILKCYLLLPFEGEITQQAIMQHKIIILKNKKAHLSYWNEKR